MKKTIATLLIAACLSHTTFAAPKTDIAQKVGLGVLATVAVIAGGSAIHLKVKSNRQQKEFDAFKAISKTKLDKNKAEIVKYKKESEDMLKDIHTLCNDNSELYEELDYKSKGPIEKIKSKLKQRK